MRGQQKIQGSGTARPYKEGFLGWAGARTHASPPSSVYGAPRCCLNLPCLIPHLPGATLELKSFFFQVPNPQGPFPSCKGGAFAPMSLSPSQHWCSYSVGHPPVFSPGLCQKSHDMKTFQQCMKQGNFLKPERSSCWNNSCECFREEP